MAMSGIVLFVKFQEISTGSLLGLKKIFWLDFHISTAVITSFLILIHMAQRWDWIENIIFRKEKIRATKAIIGKRRNNTWFIIVFFLSFITGVTNWMLDGDCTLCNLVHDKLGLLLILIFGIHLFKHAYPSRKYFGK